MLRLTQHRLMKLSYSNRMLFMRWALSFGTLGVCCLGGGLFTNDWLHTKEIIKYYEPKNASVNYDKLNEYEKPVFFKKATLGPWIFCFTNPAVRSSLIFLLLAMALEVGAWVATVLCILKPAAYKINLTSGVLHIFGGLSTFLSLIVYMSQVAKEVGKKLYPASPVDDPLFYYQYGYSFISVMASFLCIELTAILILSVYMAKHDEQMYNRYHIRSLFKTQVLGGLTVGMIESTKISGRVSQASYASSLGSSGRVGRYYRRTTSIGSSQEAVSFNKRLSAKPSFAETIEEEEDGRNGTTEMSKFLDKSALYDSAFLSDGGQRNSLSMSSFSDQDSVSERFCDSGL